MKTAVIFLFAALVACGGSQGPVEQPINKQQSMELLRGYAGVITMIKGGAGPDVLRPQLAELSQKNAGHPSGEFSVRFERLVHVTDVMLVESSDEAVIAKRNQEVKDFLTTVNPANAARADQMQYFDIVGPALAKELYDLAELAGGPEGRKEIEAAATR